MSMRVAFFVIAIFLIFAVLARTIWLRNSAIALAYEVRVLREHEADLRNENQLRRSRVAAKRGIENLEGRAEAMELELLPEASTLIPAPPVTLIALGR